MSPKEANVDTFNVLLPCTLFSDIHGNLPALEAVLADIARQPTTKS